MRKSNIFKNLILISFNCVIVIVVSIISIISFISPAIKSQAETNDLLSIYEETKYDYIISNPSDEQIQEFKHSSNVKNVVPYYQLVYTFNINNEDVELTMKSIDSNDDITYTEFAKERLVKETEYNDKVIYLDYNFANRYNIKIGDSIGNGTMMFKVAGLYQNYELHLTYVPRLKDIINADIAYSGVYVYTSNKEEFKKEFLNDYKPLATLKDRDSFTSDEAYKTYLDNFYSKDYSSYIKDKMEGYESNKEIFNAMISEINNKYLISGIISTAVILVSMILCTILIGKKNKIEVANGGRKNVLNRYLLSAICSIVIYIIVMLIGVHVCCSRQIHFISLSHVLTQGWLSYTLPLISIIVAYIVNRLIVSGYKEKKKKICDI